MCNLGRNEYLRFKVQRFDIDHWITVLVHYDANRIVPVEYYIKELELMYPYKPRAKHRIFDYKLGKVVYE